MAKVEELSLDLGGVPEDRYGQLGFPEVLDAMPTRGDVGEIIDNKTSGVGHQAEFDLGDTQQSFSIS